MEFLANHDHDDLINSSMNEVNKGQGKSGSSLSPTAKKRLVADFQNVVQEMSNIQSQVDEDCFGF